MVEVSFEFSQSDTESTSVISTLYIEMTNMVDYKMKVNVLELSTIFNEGHSLTEI